MSNTEDSKKAQEIAQDINREATGRYGLGFDRLCVCGHSKGSHVHGGKGKASGECIAHEVGDPRNGLPEPADGAFYEPCDCDRFKAAPLPRAPKARALTAAQVDALAFIASKADATGLAVLEWGRVGEPAPNTLHALSRLGLITSAKSRMYRVHTSLTDAGKAALAAAGK
jgi:hypothetical protein